eukprot:1195823-Prorocentrum_minimum.AAC.8
MEPEEPVLSNGFICEFSDLQIRAVLLDDVMRAPDHPDKVRKRRQGGMLGGHSRRYRGGCSVSSFFSFRPPGQGAEASSGGHVRGAQ